MKIYFCIESEIYTLTKKQVKELNKLNSAFSEKGFKGDAKEDYFTDGLHWIRDNGKFVSEAYTYNF